MFAISTLNNEQEKKKNSKGDNIEIKINDEADEVIKKKKFLFTKKQVSKQFKINEGQ